MLYRKLIKFGDSSFVVSLPKEWITKNSLKKGDLIGVEHGTKNELFLMPKSKPNRELTETTINLDELHHAENLKTFIISAYLKNYDTIHIVGKDLVTEASRIRSIFHTLASVEIVEQTSKRITARSFLDPTQLKVETLIRRLEIMTRSMLEDAKTSITSKNLHEYAYQKEDDVTRLCFLIFKTLRKAMTEPEVASQLKLEPLQLMHLWNVTFALEEIADQAKRICKYLKDEKLKNKKSMDALMASLIAHFDSTMKAYHSDNPAEAVKSLQQRLEIMSLCRDRLSENMDPTGFLVIDKIRRVAGHTANIANMTLDR